MAGRDPHEQGRTSTPLELLFDLTFVIAFGTAANELAHALAEGHVGDGILGFCFAVFAVSLGVDQLLLVRLGLRHRRLDLPAHHAWSRWSACWCSRSACRTCSSRSPHGDHVDDRVMVLGYVVMRVPMVLQWARAMRQDAGRAAACRSMVVSLVITQVGWVLLLAVDAGAHLGLRASMVVVVVLIAVEVAGPAVAERRDGGTPWHPHHIAERYGLLVIVTLGEGLLGTMATLSAQVGPHGPGWSLDVAVLGLAGIALTFGLWWTYFVVRVGRRPARPAASAPSAGATATWRSSARSWRPARACTPAPTTSSTTRRSRPRRPCSPWSCPSPSTCVDVRPLRAAHPAARPVPPAADRAQRGRAGRFVPLAVADVPLEWCLLVLPLTPWVTVVGYELVGHRHQADVVARMTES